MFEKIPFESNKGSEKKAEKKHSASFIRHSRASYKTYSDILASEEPLKDFDPEKQSFPDLSEAGIELATKEAEKFFDTLDPVKDSLFFASSDQARALETANIYRQVAHARGFKVIKHENVRSKKSDEILRGEIRTFKNLSLDHTGGVLLGTLFNSPKKRPAINWEKIDPKLKDRYEQASKIIEADDKGSFGANLATHGKAVKKLFPELKTTEELFEKEFQNLIRLFKFGMSKAQEAEGGNNIKILAFGHENYMMDALRKYFDEDEIKNCETIHFSLGDDNEIKAEFRGKKVTI